MSTQKDKQCVAIVGTGDLARGLSRKLAEHGYRVTCGSRRPTQRQTSFVHRSSDFASLDVTITSIPECIAASDIVILSLHPEHIPSILQQNEKQIKGKVLVDVTNPTDYKQNDIAHVQRWAEQFPGASFVKALNSVSAYELENCEIAGDRVVFIAGDHKDANAKIDGLVRSLGYFVVMAGGLNKARSLEEGQTTLWRGWGIPVLITSGTFVAWGIYGTLRYNVWKGNAWSMLPVNTMNKVYACTSLTLLSLCYLPGCIAKFVQFYNGTKHKPFPGWLDAWLKMRKELGLISLTLAATHCVLSVAHLSPAYFKNWFETSLTLPVNNGMVTVPTSVMMNWKGETVILLGTLALGTMSILGVTSIPSVMTSLNWRQWDFVHTGLGYTCLGLATAHVLMKGAPDWPGKSFVEIAKGMAFISTVLPSITMGMRTLLALPCISRQVRKIRRGWERRVEDSED